MYFFEPVNLKQWNMFEKVKTLGHVEPFLATKAMELGDVVLLHVGQQDKNFESGIYAYGTVVKGPFILTNHPDDYCNGKNSVLVKFERFDRKSPIITHDECKSFSKQFRTVHMIDSCYYPHIEEMLHKHEG